jgi:glycosyltransferase involved in cell wall biosynthesis
MWLSIVIPTFNRAALVKECLISCSKLVEIAELVVVDDCSTDGTRAVLDELAITLNEAGTRMRAFYPAQNQGAPACRNIGLVHAQGKYVMFLDSDDVVIPSGIERLVEHLLGDSTLDYTYGKVIRTDGQLKPLPDDTPVGKPFSDTPSELAGYHWHTMGAMYKRSYLKNVGLWNEALSGSQDWEYQARVKLAGGRGQFIDTVVGYWRHHDGNRVGAKAFRPDYVRSVMIACDSILQNARKVGRCDNALERRLAKKLIVHALEWGANGHTSKRRECLLQAAGFLSDDRLYRTIASCVQISPVFMDSWLWKVLTEHKRKQSRSAF